MVQMSTLLRMMAWKLEEPMETINFRIQMILQILTMHLTLIESSLWSLISFNYELFRKPLNRIRFQPKGTFFVTVDLDTVRGLKIYQKSSVLQYRVIETQIRPEWSTWVSNAYTYLLILTSVQETLIIATQMPVALTLTAVSRVHATLVTQDRIRIGFS